MAYLSQEDTVATDYQNGVARPSTKVLKKKDVVTDPVKMIESTRNDLLRRVQNLEDVIRKSFDALLEDLKN